MRAEHSLTVANLNCAYMNLLYCTRSATKIGQAGFISNFLLKHPEE